jgi:hypothetical protein
MSKRFLDTGFLDQKWIRKLPPDKKIFLIYLMLKCDNAGIIELDFDDASFWIGKKIEDTEFLPEGYLIPINGSGKYFMPKFIEWQYKDLKSDKHIVAQARQSLDKYGLIDDDFNLCLDKVYVNVTEDLTESQATSKGKGIDKGGVGEKLTREEKSFAFYSDEVKKAKEFTDQMSKDYVTMCNRICKKENGSWLMPFVLKIEKQISLCDFSKLYEKAGKNLEKITTKIDSIQSTIKYHNKYDNLYLTINTWFNRDLK